MTNRLDRVMRGLEALQNDADGIYVNAWLAEQPKAGRDQASPCGPPRWPDYQSR